MPKKPITDNHIPDQETEYDQTWIEDILSALTLDEKIALMSGEDFWSTPAVARLNIPKLKMTDGPNGARGDFAGLATATCFPVGVALASSWDRALIHEVGVALGEETKTKGAQILLGPTINLQRTPIGGRNFECFSEDPYLTAESAVAYINGVQSTGVAACAKHFVANDTEFERHTISVDIEERPLRELYLTPFEAAVKQAHVWSVMSAYNRINGVYASAHHELLNTILRLEWGFDGLIISDWGAALETIDNANGGLDLEMPGPTRIWGAALKEAINKNQVKIETINDHIRNLLRLVKRVRPQDHHFDYGQYSIDNLEHRTLARKAAAAGMILIKNDDPILPCNTKDIQTIAVIGPNAMHSQIQGGGSSGVRPHYTVCALDGIKAGFGKNTHVLYEPGCVTHKHTPAITPTQLFDKKKQSGGLSCELFNNDQFQGTPTLTQEPRSEIYLLEDRHTNKDNKGLSLRLTGYFQPEQDGDHQFGLMSAGLSRFFVDDQEVIDNWTSQCPGESFFGFGSQEKTTTLSLKKGKPHKLQIEFTRPPLAFLGGIRYGILPPTPINLVERAVEAAQKADLTILVLGSNKDWESEGHDRSDMDLPGNQNLLTERILMADPNTVIVMNAGAPMNLPWFSKVKALLWTWFPGQEFGNALCDVLTGRQEPGGRSPISMPQKLEDHPAFPNYPGTDGHMAYEEGLLMGYRHYDVSPPDPLIPFGHGLSYAVFDYIAISAPATIPSGNTVFIETTLQNISQRNGTEVIQLYVKPISPLVTRPLKELKGFAKIHLEPGETRKIPLHLNGRAFSYWDVERQKWQCDPGQYDILIGRSSTDIRLCHRLTLIAQPK